MAVNVDAARHDDGAAEIVAVIGLSAGGSSDDAAVADIEIARNALLAVLGIVDAAAGKTRDHARAPRLSTIACATAATLGNAVLRTESSGKATTASARTSVPGWSSPGTPTRISTAASPVSAMSGASSATVGAIVAGGGEWLSPA